MADDLFIKTAVPLVVLTFLGVYNLPAITQEEVEARAMPWSSLSSMAAATKSAPLERHRCIAESPAIWHIWTAIITASLASLIDQDIKQSRP